MDDAFAKAVLAVEPTREPFKPRATKCPDSGSIEALWGIEQFWGELLAPGLVIYRGRKTGDVVGCLIDNPRLGCRCRERSDRKGGATMVPPMVHFIPPILQSQRNAEADRTDDKRMPDQTVDGRAVAPTSDEVDDERLTNEQEHAFASSVAWTGATAASNAYLALLFCIGMAIERPWIPLVGLVLALACFGFGHLAWAKFHKLTGGKFRRQPNCQGRRASAVGGEAEAIARKAAEGESETVKRLRTGRSAAQSLRAAFKFAEDSRRDADRD